MVVKKKKVKKKVVSKKIARPSVAGRKKAAPKKKAKPKKKVQPKKKEVAKKKEKQIGTVSNYFKHVKAAAIKLTAPLKVGDKIRLKGGETDFEMKVKSMQADREKIEKGKKGDEVGLLVPKDVHQGYRVFLVK